MENELNADRLMDFMAECHAAEELLKEQYDDAAVENMLGKINEAIEGNSAASIMVALAVILGGIAAASPNIKLTCAVVGNVASQMARSFDGAEGISSSARH
jgi:type IV secretory pathway VirB2 component (pilin)